MSITHAHKRTSQISLTHTHTHRQRYGLFPAKPSASSNTPSSSHHNYHNHSILTKNADSRAGQIQANSPLQAYSHTHCPPPKKPHSRMRRHTRTHTGRDTHSHKLASRVLSDFGELNRPRRQTNGLSPARKPLFGQIVCMTVISTLTLNLLQVI